MDKSNLKVLRELHEKATPGPWEVDPTGDIGTHFIGTTDEAVAYFEPIGETIEVDGEFENPQSATNAACTAAARNALPALLAIAEAARAWREAAEQLPGIPLGNASAAAWAKLHEAAVALRAALALVEEWMPDKPSELKPCPFCGADANENEGYVWCSDGDCDGAGIFALSSTWNRRTPDRAALVEVARRALAIYHDDPTQDAFLQARADRVVGKYLAEQAGKDDE